MSKITSVENRLKLKKYNSKSLQFSQNKDTQEDEKNDTNSKVQKEINSPTSSNEDDSLADFRSPKIKVVPKLQFQVESLKCKRKILSGKSKTKKDGANKQSRVKKTITESNQPLIESSFFKPPPNDVKTAFMCPLCFKTSKDEITHTAHTKTCAVKNKISTKQLMDAMQLQERQAEERKALGLLSAPVLQPKKPSISSRIKKFASSDDPQLQLALALSKSLHEAEQIEQLEDVEVLAQAAGEPIIISSEEERRKTLQNFGFTTNKPIIESVNSKVKKKKLAGKTILQIRSQEEKERILTEKIAEILTGDDAVSQVVSNESQNALKKKKAFPLRSPLLQEILKTKNRLWDRTDLLIITYDSFYVEDLSPFIKPCKTDPPKYTISKYLPSPEFKINQMENETTKIIKTPIKTTSDEVASECLNSSKPKVDCDKKYNEIFISNWADTLNDSSASDIILFVKNDRQVWIHKLVFYVRCSNILLDIIACNDERFPRIKEQIRWEDTERSAALAFLEFIYCGVIKRYAFVIEDEKLLVEIRRLARRYRVKDLFDYLREKQSENIDDDKIQSFTCRKKADIKEEEVIEVYDISKNTENIPKVDSVQENECEEVAGLTKNNPEIIKIHDNRSYSASPDMFEDTIQIQQNDCGEKKDSSDDDHDGNLKALLSLVNKDETVIESQPFELTAKLNKNVTIRTKAFTVNTQVEKLGRKNTDVLSDIKNREEKTKEIENEVIKIVSSDETSCSPQKHDVQIETEPRQLSEMSAFITKVQKYNALSLSDSESCLDDSPLRLQLQSRRNPFDKRWRDSLLCDKGKTPSEKPMSGLSLFERSLLRAASKCSSPINNNKSAQADIVQKDKEFSKLDMSCNSEDSALFETEKETDVEDLSMYSRYKKDHKDNSIDKYRAALQNVSQNEETPCGENFTQKAIDHCDKNSSKPEKNDEVIILSDSETESFSNFTCLNAEFDNSVLTQSFHSEKSLCDDMNDEDNVKERNENTPNRSAKKRNYSHSPIDINFDMESDNEKILESVTKRRKLSTNEDLSNELNVDENPQLNFNVNQSQSKKRRKLSKNVDSSDELSQSRLTKSPKIQSPKDRQLNSSTIIICSNSEDSNESSYSVKKNDKQQSPQNDFNSTNFFMNFETPEFIRRERQLVENAVKNTVETPKIRRHVSLSPQNARSDTRTLKTKTVSEKSFRTKILQEHNESQKLSPESSSELSEKQSSREMETKKKIMPNFSNMDTPQLKKELKKYGLKPLKRNKATQLLTHIHNQLHARNSTRNVRSSQTDSSSEDDEIQTKQSKELDCDKSEESCGSESCSNIKDAFLKMIKNSKDLHNKILTYEPIKLELLHSMLKADGFKCKINTLMDFLDEQCITFTAQTQLANRRRKTKKNF